MLDRTSARRPAQVNACFEGGSSRTAEIVAGLREAGLTDEQITVIDRPDPEDAHVPTEEMGFVERLKALFGGKDAGDTDEKRYDLLILVHLGEQERLAESVQEVFRRFDAARVNYYPSAEPNMRVLGGADAAQGTTLTPTTGAAGARVEPGELRTDTTTHVHTSAGGGEKVEREEEVVFRGETGVVVEEPARAAAPATAVPAVTPTTRPDGARVEPGELPADSVTHIHTAEEKVEEEREAVYRGETRAVVEGEGTGRGETTPAPGRGAARDKDPRG